MKVTKKQIVIVSGVSLVIVTIGTFVEIQRRIRSQKSRRKRNRLRRLEQKKAAGYKIMSHDYFKETQLQLDRILKNYIWASVKVGIQRPLKSPRRFMDTILA